MFMYPELSEITNNYYKLKRLQKNTCPSHSWPKQKKRSLFEDKYPIQKGEIVDWEDMEFLLETCFQKLWKKKKKCFDYILILNVKSLYVRI